MHSMFTQGETITELWLYLSLYADVTDRTGYEAMARWVLRFVIALRRKRWTFEPRCEKFPTRSDTNQAVQPQKIAKGVKFQI